MPDSKRRKLSLSDGQSSNATSQEPAQKSEGAPSLATEAVNQGTSTLPKDDARVNSSPRSWLKGSPLAGQKGVAIVESVEGNATAAVRSAANYLGSLPTGESRSRSMLASTLSKAKTSAGSKSPSGSPSSRVEAGSLDGSTATATATATTKASDTVQESTATATSADVGSVSVPLNPHKASSTWSSWVPGASYLGARPGNEPPQTIAIPALGNETVLNTDRETETQSTIDKSISQPEPAASWLGVWRQTPKKPDLASAQSANEDEKPTEEVPPVETENVKEPTNEGSRNSGWFFWTSSSNGRATPVSLSSETPVPPQRPRSTVSDSQVTLGNQDASVEIPHGTKSANLQDSRTLGAASHLNNQVIAKKSTQSLRASSKERKEKDSLAPPTRNLDVGVKQQVQKSPSTPIESVSNLLLPTLEDAYQTSSEPLGLLRKVSRYFYQSSAPSKHPSLISQAPKIKKALAIGVHGYFPSPFIQTIVGKPRGTSVKFAEEAAQALARYSEKHGNCIGQVERIALEGEGKIAGRIAALWKLLLNWIDMIRSADLILFACHSQGVPVAISLISMLIDFGCLTNAKVGVCAMAGINLGPFPDYESRWIGGSAAELFEFSRADSEVSKSYRRALENVIQFGAKITFVGSLDDQLVSLHSSTFGTMQHPHIYRAVWVDGRLHAPNFLVHLVGFALKLGNLGVSDHGLIRELSNPLAGSLVGGEGHSRIYEDPQVYDLSLRFLLETSRIDGTKLRSTGAPSSAGMNPYILPFAVRGVLEEDIVRNELAGETRALLEQFEQWQPSTKALKDVKYRLEGIRAKMHG